MRKNIIIISLIFIIPIVAYMVLNHANSSTAQVDTTAHKPQVIKFTSQMCLDCQKMNKIFKEIFPKYEGKIILTEIPVQDSSSFTQEQIKKHNVTLVPTIILIDSNGKIIKRIEGAIDKEIMDNYLKGLK